MPGTSLDKSLHKTLHSHTQATILHVVLDVRHLKTVLLATCGIKMTFSSMSVCMCVHVYTCVHMVIIYLCMCSSTGCDRVMQAYYTSIVYTICVLYYTCIVCPSEASSLLGFY